MRLPLYQVDAFSSRVFGGNPAAVVPLEVWLPADTMQAIAAENNLSETAFIVREGEGWSLRWFTPTVEVDLCGHATLASAFVIFTQIAPGRDSVRFDSKSGPLIVTRHGDLLALDFPSWPPEPCPMPDGFAAAIGKAPAQLLSARSYLAVYEREEDVRTLAPNMDRLAALGRSVIATAPGTSCDFVSRYFAPGKGIPEDPVTGSAHCTLTPYWAKRLGKAKLAARQISRRGGELVCEDRGARVSIAGRAALYLEGAIHV
jgi:PhzF family phenazine biosynthesis protein